MWSDGCCESSLRKCLLSDSLFQSCTLASEAFSLSLPCRRYSRESCIEQAVGDKAKFDRMQAPARLEYTVLGKALVSANMEFKDLRKLIAL